MASLPVSAFAYANGTPVANGYLLVRLVVDGAATANQIHRAPTRVQLDATGTIIGTLSMFTNSSILPSGSYYIITVFSQQGQLVAGPNKVII